MNWNEILEIAEKENCDVINLDGSAKDNESSLYEDEYSSAVCLMNIKDEVIVIWKDNKDGKLSFSNINELVDDMVNDILDSIP